MDLNVSSKFNELSAMELNEVDGGEWKWYYDVVIWMVTPPGLGTIIAKDLRNAYENGYAEGSAL